MTRFLLVLAIAVLPLSAMEMGAGAVARAQSPNPFIQDEIAPGTVPDEIPGVGVDETFDTPVPADVTFRDHTGRMVRIGDFIDGERPVILTLVYHQCASFCDMVMQSLTTALIQQPWTVGIEFDVITLSIDPRDTPEVTAEARSRALGRYGRAEAERGWHFLSGTEAQIAQVADAIGYHFVWEERTQQFAHPGAIMFLAPNGRVARYLYGLELDHNDIRLALIDADEGRRVASTIEQAVLYCYTWDHADGTYVIAARRLMKVGGFVTMIALGGFLFVFWRRERKKGREAASSPESSPASSAPDAGRARKS